MLSDSPEGTKLNLNLLLFGFLIDIINIIIFIVIVANIAIIVQKQAERNHHLWQ